MFFFPLTEAVTCAVIHMTEAFLRPLVHVCLFWTTPDRNGIIYGGVIVLDLARGAIRSSPSVTLKHDAFHLDW